MGNDLPQILSIELHVYSFNVHIIEGTVVKDIAMTTGCIMSPQVHLLYINVLSRHMRFKGAYGNLYTVWWFKLQWTSYMAVVSQMH